MTKVPKINLAGENCSKYHIKSRKYEVGSMKSEAEEEMTEELLENNFANFTKATN